MIKVIFGRRFKQDFKKAKKQHRNINKLEHVIQLLAKGQKLDLKFKDHALIGNYHGYRELHIESDWLLIYKINNEELILVLARTGSHSYLFNK